MEQDNNHRSNLLNSYKELSIDDKRNEYSKELIFISTLVNSYLSKHGINKNTIAYNYKSGKDLNKSESDLLDIYYGDIIEIKHNLITLLSIMEKNNK